MSKQSVAFLLVIFSILIVTLLGVLIEDKKDNHIKIKCNDSYYFAEKYDTIPNGIKFYDVDKEMEVEIHGTYVILKPNEN